MSTTMWRLPAARESRTNAILAMRRRRRMCGRVNHLVENDEYTALENLIGLCTARDQRQPDRDAALPRLRSSQIVGALDEPLLSYVLPA